MLAARLIKQSRILLELEGGLNMGGGRGCRDRLGSLECFSPNVRCENEAWMEDVAVAENGQAKIQEDAGFGQEGDGLERLLCRDWREGVGGARRVRQEETDNSPTGSDAVR